MFFLYYSWVLSLYILSYTHKFLEILFFTKNNPFLIKKRTFKFISFFEKIILVFFYKNGWFENSMANLYRKKDIIDYRKNSFPLIHAFHLNFNKVDYTINNLKFFIKQYNYFLKNFIFKNKILKILKLCFISDNNFINFFSLQIIFFEKYFNLHSYSYFYEKSNLNLVKLNRIFSLFLFNAFAKLKYFNLDKWNDWYNFNFNKNSYFKKPSKRKSKKDINFKKNKIIKWSIIVIKYKNKLTNFNSFFKKPLKSILYFNFNFNTFNKIKINNDFYSLLKYYIIKFSESSISKHINMGNTKHYNLQFLRKNRIFNKGRYSRNRQLYRTGVYWCLWLNIIMVYGLYFMFYRFSFNFGYFWWGILFLAYSTIFSRVVKYNFYNIKYLIKEFSLLIKWNGYIFFNIIYFFKSIIKNYLSNFISFSILLNYRNKKIIFLYNNFFFFLKFYLNFIKKNKNVKINYMWQGMKNKDKSIFRYKTILHWLKEIYRLIIT